MPSSPRKPARRAPSAAAAPVVPSLDVELAASAEPVARYTWAEIRARVAAPDAATLATYRVAVAPKKLVAEGALIASERILTDLRVWLGQILDWWAALPPAERALVEGFSEARLQVVTHHAFVLHDLVARATKKHAASEHAAAVAVADDVYRQAQDARRRLRAVLDQAAHAEVGFAESVAAADAAASDAVALQATLGALVALAEKVLQQGGPVAAVLQADGFGAASTARYTALRMKLVASHEQTRGAAGSGPVTQATLDEQDGVLLVYMGGLRETFRAFRRTDPRAPGLVARSTGSYFGRRPRAPAAASAPADIGAVPPAQK
jgi:hypothetical protein